MGVAGKEQQLVMVTYFLEPEEGLPGLERIGIRQNIIQNQGQAAAQGGDKGGVGFGFELQI